MLLIAWLMLVMGQLAYAAADETPGPDAPPNASLNEQVIRIPGEEPPAVTLQVTILHPNGNGPFPLAIMNHGATGASMGHRGERYRLTNAAFYFLSRGYAVVLPMMRGFSTSGGEIYHFGCDLAATGTAYAKDIRAVIRYLGNDPRFDTRRVIVAGQSFGGWNTLAVGALRIPNVVGLVNFNGGIRSSDCKAGDASLVAAAGDLGARTKIPSIWFYGENDELFPVPVWRAMYDRYTRSGGHAELVDVGVVMKNSHNFLAYPEVLPLWTSRIDNFLAGIGMPYADVNPGDMPLPFPPATQFAAVTDVAAVPYLSDNGRVLYRKFLDLPFPRVFLITATGGAASVNGGFDPLGRALTACQRSGARCGVYAVDDHVVWKPFPTGPRERAYNVTAKADQTTTVDFSSRLNPDCSPKAFAKFRIVQPPTHGRVDIGQKDDFPKFPANSPFAVCNKNPVHGVAVTYTPAQGFTGEDVFIFAEDGATGPTTALKISLTVK
ncbi:MAG: prolyl oligopeptidase family serine peptidase [Rhodopila sp.]|nr:prolyl oligopeptidase family serine peptidase [Rhodopila sp.]